MDDVRRGRLGTAYTSDYVFDEAVTAALIRTRRVDLAIKLGKLILGSKEDSIPSLARLIRVDERIFTKAWMVFKVGRYEGLSFTDHTILAHLKDLNIDALMSFDSDFDGLTARIP